MTEANPSVCPPEERESTILASYHSAENEDLPMGGKRHEPVIDSLLPGVIQMKAINGQLGLAARGCLYFSMFLLCYAANLNWLTMSIYQGYATSTWQQHSLLSTINVVRGVIAAAVLPLTAQLSDILGRVECLMIVTLFFVLGSILQASASNIETFATGSLFLQIGYTCSQLLVEIVVSDVTPLEHRLFFLFFPSMPNIVNVWISGNVTSAILTITTWRWGIGIWSIINFVCAMPMIIFLLYQGYCVPKKEDRKALFNLRQAAPSRAAVSEIFRKIDGVGIFLLTATLSLLLIPLTLAGGESQKWETPGIIAPVALGAISLPLYVGWESKARHPLMPFSLLKDRAVWAAIGIAFFGATVSTIQSEFLYTVLLVGYDFSIMAATRISVVSGFSEVVFGLAVAVAIIRFQRAKWFIVAGMTFLFAANGLMYHYRGGTDGTVRAGIIAGQVLFGGGIGTVTFPNILIAMASVKHENLAVLTSIWLAMNWAGYAVGNCVAGAIWTQNLYSQLQKNLGPINSTLPDAVYAEPLYIVPEYPPGTPERTAIIGSYKFIQRLLTITTIGFTVPVLILSLCLRNPKLRGNPNKPQA